ncbi:cytochrome-c peroxidase [Pedobacter mendelii]|uniref:Cytochrome-c peroxidase n=1 Tax=Pedobacter mendelii TaxID=1908240 RepID=A0ABQ2BH25_9SPHI|nr:cytochrome c peroxidase [Pedobacter mendelii]GGI26078.1 cytochrome-c peroxidase [Pedobacter mendelii]
MYKGNNAFLQLSACILFACVLTACKKDNIVDEIIPKLTSVKLKAGSNFPAIDNDIDNPLTAEGIELGRLLFYDTRLSGNNKISCASCHRQDIAFTDAVALTNIGASGKKLERHTPALFNLAWAKNGLFWDGGSTNLESQAFGPLTSADEMHQNLVELETELKQVPNYVTRFKAVFNEEVKSANIVKALAQFQRTLISDGSKYDQYVRKENNVSLLDVEISGMNLVKAKCGSCHVGELFTDDLFRNNGIDDTYPDDLEGIYQGRFRVTFNLADLGKFKTPSLRNVMLTAPYMHDGRFKTIDDVLEHYNSGIKISATLDKSLYQNNGNVGIPISATEKIAIKAFLSALTDNSFISNKKFSNPN